MGPCPMFEAVSITLLDNATGLPIDGGKASATDQVGNVFACMSECSILGGPGLHAFVITAPGYVTATVSTTVQAIPTAGCGCQRNEVSHVTVRMVHT